MSVSNQPGAEQQSVLEQNSEIAEQERLARIVTRNHLAVFALACSISGVEWVDSESPDENTLGAVRHQENGTQVQLPASIYKSLPGSVMTESGFALKSRLEFERWYPDTPRVLSSMFDMILLGDSMDTLASSKISIERPSSQDPTVSSIVGLTAIHSVQYRYLSPHLELLNENAGMRGFKPLIDTLIDTSGGTADYSDLEDEISGAYSNLYDNHFATTEELGVPDVVMDRARKNFITLSSHIGLLANSQAES